MAKTQKKSIGIKKAEQDHGIASKHEEMENGELRFRLNASDGSSYIRTESAEDSGWQNSHFHKTVRETYIVQKGWMAFASWKNNTLSLNKYEQGDMVTTEPMVPHNVYLPSGSVIHTVKHGEIEEGDWYGHEGLDNLTKSLSESEVLQQVMPEQKQLPYDERFPAYVNIYNNLDNLIWRIPSYFVTVAAILMAFIGNFLSKPNATFSPVLLATIFLFIGLLFLMGTYSMSRLRLHHTRMGNELKALENSGYFHRRGETVGKKWPPPAPVIFMYVFSTMGLFFMVLGIVAAVSYDTIISFLQ